jgi:hypothetical protein
MKTSNKLLLGIFLSILILTTTIQLMVFAKYKRGDYTPFKREQYSQFTSLKVPPFKFVSVKGLGDCKIITSDTAKLEIQQYKQGQVYYRIVNDTLIIDGGALGKDPDNGNRSRNYQTVKVYVPPTVYINAVSSDVRLAGTPDSASAPSFAIHLENYSFLGVYNKDQENADMYFNRLQVTSASSNIEFDDHIIINSLQFDKMVSSELDDKNALIKSITINADDNSKVNLSGKNVKALK